MTLRYETRRGLIAATRVCPDSTGLSPLLRCHSRDFGERQHFDRAVRTRHGRPKAGQHDQALLCVFAYFLFFFFFDFLKPTPPGFSSLANCMNFTGFASDFTTGVFVAGAVPSACAGSDNASPAAPTSARCVNSFMADLKGWN